MAVKTILQLCADTGSDLFYQVCYRCGINFAVPAWSVSVFCRDYFHPDLIGVFRMLDYEWLFEGAA